MFERFMEWLRSLFGRPSDPLEALDPTRLRDQMALLDVERGRALDAIERKETQRAELMRQARTERQTSTAPGVASSSVRLTELARQIAYVDQEISDRQTQLDQIHEQRKAIHQFLRFAERAELMRRYGLDKIIGRHIDMGALQQALEKSVTGGVLDMESLAQASTMLGDALAFTRTQVNDPDVLRVLDEITETPQSERPTQGASSIAQPDSDVDAILREFERDA